MGSRKRGILNHLVITDSFVPEFLRLKISGGNGERNRMTEKKMQWITYRKHMAGRQLVKGAASASCDE